MPRDAWSRDFWGIFGKIRAPASFFDAHSAHHEIIHSGNLFIKVLAAELIERARARAGLK